MSQKLLENSFEWVEDTSEFNEDLIKSYNEENDEEYFFEFDVQNPGKLHDLYNDLPVLPERMKIEKVDNLVANLYNKTEYVILTRNFKKALSHDLVLKQLHRVIKFNHWFNY